SSKRRWQAIGDLRIVMEAAEAEPPATIVGQQAVLRPLWRRAIPLLVAIALTAAITAVSVWSLKPSPSLNVTRFAITLGEGQRFTTAGARPALAISPDGTQIVYEANRRLYHRSMSESEARAIPGTENFAIVVNPVFSPDGRSVAFVALGDQ